MTPIGAQNEIAFVVRDDASRSKILFQTADATWVAYNRYGGNSLYFGDGPGQGGSSYKVSYNRPITGGGGDDIGVVPPQLLTGTLRGRDFPREYLDQWPRGAQVFTRLRGDARG